ncbi:MAG TPA: hypothetical protein PK014_08635 [Thermoanaerobaculia bacterium]|nr:hypothetical protein [Thermoanaerobaculia bacterium]HUM30258.1 hypothetical protein [Thermoanaerobaculia bacterium]HXK68446.1 hypothetical protein [Thermoanaerobaculia bacterium]
MKTRMFAVCLILVLPLAALAQGDGGFGIKIGSFSPNGDYLDTWYGNMTTLSIVYVHPVARNTTLEYGVDYTKKSGDTYSYYDPDFDADIYGDSELEIVPLLLTVRYSPCNRTGFCPFFGAGVGYYLVEETLDYDVYDYVYDDYYRVIDSDQDDVFGFHAVVGFEIRQRSGGALSVEARWSTAEARLWRQDVELDGVTALLGYRFRF